MMDSTDATLVDRTRNGDERAFAELVRRYQAAVWGTAHRLLGNSSEKEDAVQETFLRAFTALGKFDPKYPFGPWILRIAANYCIDQLRKRKSGKTRLWSELGDLEQERLLRDFTRDGGVESSVKSDLESYAEAARSLLDRLNPKYRAAFVLREVEEREYDEVAEILGTTGAAARVRVCRARSELQKKLSELPGIKTGKKRDANENEKL
ncbi:MAG: sigma-70 family RNA polymerase sigma factor [Acidobacteriota bacterium]|jgi:RNA polymerase sigma-70 factor (ECF subfamily)|nr:sigma-70 family RNA polymerase sigma factor [Acidobacteriota bacterium]